MKTYYVSINGTTYGPSNYETLEEWYKGGSLLPTDFVWSEEENSWKPIREIPELAKIFLSAPSNINVEDASEIPTVESKETKKSNVIEEIIFCDNHDSIPSTFVCSQCKRSLCDKCKDNEIQEICIDCSSINKDKSTGTKKRNIIIVVAVFFIIALTFATYIFFGPKVVEQPTAPPKIEIKLGVAPRLDLEGLTPEEYSKAESDLLSLHNACKKALADTTFVLANGSEWIQQLTEKGFLPAPVAPPRTDLIYRLGASPPEIELWLMSEKDSHCIFIAQSDTVISAKKAKSSILPITTPSKIQTR